MRNFLWILFIAAASVFIFGAYSISPKQTSPIQTFSTNQIAASTSTFPLSTSTKTQATTTAKAVKPKIKASLPVSKPLPRLQSPAASSNGGQAPVTLTPIISPPPVNYEAINQSSRPAVVNILCSAQSNDFSPISGTGVIISPDGVILTNAHVAEFYLLQNWQVKNFIQCVIRTGNPAYPRYKAELVYISPAWVEANKTILKQSVQIGTGENDFAFLKITGTTSGSALPSSFPYVAPDTREVIDKGETVVLISYPAEFLGGISIVENLNLVSAVTNISDYFTFKTSTIDVVALPGTVVSQRGSSGGAVVDKNSELLGIISTSSEGATTGSRDLNAITLGYINRTLQNEIGISLSAFLSQNLDQYAQTFNQTVAPGLSKLIIDELNKQ